MNYSTFQQQFEQTCNKYKEQNAIAYLKEDNRIEYCSYQHLLETVQVITARLQAVGLENADRVAIISPHTPDAVIAGIALAYCGYTDVLIDASLPLDEIQRLLKESDVAAVFVDILLQKKMDEESLKGYPVFLLNSHDSFVLSEKGLKETRGSNVCDQDKEIMAIIYSSGTTDRMKGICITYQSIVSSISIYKTLTGVQSGNRYLYVLPFNHIAGYSGALQHILMGCEIDMIEKMDSTKLTNAFLVFQPHYFAIVPRVYEIIEEKIRSEIHRQGKDMMFERMLDVSRFFRKKFSINIGKILFSSIRKQIFGTCMKGIGVGASPCKRETADFFLAIGYDWANFYSSTEIGVPAVATGIHDRYPDDTVGNVNQFKEIQVKLLGMDKDGIGEIAVRGPLTMKGYFRNQELTNKVKDSEGYVRTGDLGLIDKRGYLHLVGRAKEVIILHNGKKVSPYDVEAIYAQHLKNSVEIACCGITNPRNGYDEIHLFVEQTKDVEQVVSLLWQISETQKIYRIEQIHVIPHLPKTSIGKIKRNELKKMAGMTSASKENCNDATGKSIEQIIAELLCKISNQKEITDYTWTLRDDLQMDSLQLFEFAVEVEKVFGVNITAQLASIITVKDLMEYANEGWKNEKDMSDTDYDVKDFPMERTKEDYKRLHRWITWMQYIYKVEVQGEENIPKDKSFILSANHASFFDPLWMLLAIDGKKNIDNIVCLAAKHTMKGFVNNKFFRMLGCIPVNREGNTVPVLLRAKECMDKEYMLIIFPEGARSRDGSMLPFKEGCAQIAWKARKSIVPVAIEGGYEIFPRWNKLPHIFNFRKMQRYPLKITFCKPIEPSEDYEAVTRKMREEIAEKL